MLLDLLNGQEKSKLVLLTDMADCPGRHLLLNWMIRLGTRCNKVILVCFERSPQFFYNFAPSDMQQKLICINGSKTASPLTSEKSDPFDDVANCMVDASRDIAVVVDSLTLYLMSTSAPHTCSRLHQLATDSCVSQVVALVHRDIHDVHTCALVQHIATSTIDLQSHKGNRHNCQIRHCRPTGKVFKTRESFSFDDNFHIQAVGPSPIQDMGLPSEATPQNDPTADLPFNLSLSEREKEARSQVRLPYLKDSGSDVNNSTQDSGGKIIYQPDEADDFDEEDPDDDLNI